MNELKSDYYEWSKIFFTFSNFTEDKNKSNSQCVSKSNRIQKNIILHKVKESFWSIITAMKFLIKIE